MLFYAGEGDDEADLGLDKLPPCTIESKVVVDGLEYPIVRSHSLHHGYVWNDSSEMLADALIELTNLAHGDQSIVPILTYVSFKNVSCHLAHRIQPGPHPNWLGVDLALRPPEVVLGTSFDTKVDIWMLGAAVRFTYLFLHVKNR